MSFVSSSETFSSTSNSSSSSSNNPGSSRDQMTFARPFTELFAANNMSNFSNRGDTSCGREAASSAGITAADLQSQSSDDAESAITMQHLIDSIVEESFQKPLEDSNYIRASETMFQKMLNGERSWKITSSQADPNFDYQSRLENLSVLNNLLMSMEMGPSSTTDAGASIISQMMTNNAPSTTTAGSTSSSSSSFLSGTSQHTITIPVTSQGNVGRKCLQPTYRKSQREKRHANQSNMEHQNQKQADSDSSASSGERSPESASDSASSLCDNCNNMKIEGHSNSGSEESSSCGSQISSTESRNSSPSNKIENMHISGNEPPILPPMPPLIEVTRASPLYDQRSSVSANSDGNAESATSPRDEIKHPKKRMRDRHFRETRNSSSGTNSDSGGSSGSENSSGQRYVQNFQPVFTNISQGSAPLFASPNENPAVFSQQYLQSVLRQPIQVSPPNVQIPLGYVGNMSSQLSNTIIPPTTVVPNVHIPNTAAEPTTIYEQLQRAATHNAIATCYASPLVVNDRIFMVPSNLNRQQNMGSSQSERN